MNSDILIQSPFRRPQWRLDRVRQMIGHRPEPLRPRWFDDHNVRAYRNVLLRLAAAGDDEARGDQVFVEYPDVCCADPLHYSPNIETRENLEARLLTTESFEKIASRMATQPKAIEYFEALFFNVRDRLSNSDWIGTVIRETFDADREAENNGLSNEQRGYVLRQFAYVGGPHVLDAVIQGFAATETPQREQDVTSWLEDVLGQLVQSRAAAAASTFTISRHNAMQVLKLVLNARGAVDESPAAASILKERLEKALASVTWEQSERAFTKLDETQQRFAASAVEPRADEQIALRSGRVPATLERDLARYEAERLSGDEK